MPAAARKGNHGGGPKVIDDDMLTFAVARKTKDTPLPAIAKKLVIKTGKNAGEHPSVASVRRALVDAEEAATLAAAGDGLPLRSKAARIPRPDGPLTPEELALRERLVVPARPLPTARKRPAGDRYDRRDRTRLGVSDRDGGPRLRGWSPTARR